LSPQSCDETHSGSPSGEVTMRVMKRTLLVAIFLAFSCLASLALPANRSHTGHQHSPARLSLDLVKLAEGPCLSNARFQDSDAHGRRELMEKIIRHGTDSIAALADSLTNSRPTPEPVRCNWHGTALGDVALFALMDLFRDHKLHSTVPELEWDTFLERSSPTLTQEQVLRDFIRKHHRAGLQEKWNGFWKEHKDEVIWDSGDLCYRTRPGHH
jgi:hypothetical protein